VARTETDYTKLKNRCPNCGHRLILGEKGRCRQQSGDLHDPMVHIPCNCTRHRRGRRTQ
jgi:DNA-directed RNA polymerase subunit RPC12/RpoP